MRPTLFGVILVVVSSSAIYSAYERVIALVHGL